MQHPRLGVGHRAPAHLAIVASGVTCAITGRPQPMLRCSSCAYFQGMLVGPDPCVLCAAPARGLGRRLRARSRRPLIFDQDWPDD
jgi:hypothetical protein